MSTRKRSGIVNDNTTTLQGVVTKLIKKCWIPIAILIIIAAILSSLFRALTPWAKQYKHEVESHLSVMVGQPVTIKSMETGWYWFEPVLKLNQLTITDKRNQALKVNKLLIGINLFSSLWHWQLQPGVLYIDDVHLNIRQFNDHWEVDGLGNDGQTVTFNKQSYIPVLAWLVAQQKIIIKNVAALVHFKDGTLAPIDNLNVIISNRGGYSRLKGRASLAQTTPTELTVLADLKLDIDELNNTRGHAYISLKHFLPAQWQGFFPKTNLHVESGIGDVEAWLDVVKGRIDAVQTKLHFNNIAWSHIGKLKSQLVQRLDANLSWKPTTSGWEIRGDHLNLRTRGIRWPQNNLLIRYQRPEQSYHVFVKTLLLNSFLKTAIDWPKAMNPLLQMQPRGKLHDLQIEIKNNQIAYLLTRFVNLGWKGKAKIPSVRHISGAIYWQPTEGRLELDGENTVILPSKLPPVKFSKLNAAFDWKELSNGLRISMNRFILSRSNLILSASGILDEVTKESVGQLRMKAEFSASNAQRWLPYIPSQHLKPKLAAWLKKDVKRIGKASGQLLVNGPLADFPFDKKPGEFSITSHLNSVNLIFAPNWLLTRDIDAYLRVNKRNLEADITHANLQGIILDKMNLRIDDIGLDRESLLIHGKVKAPADKIMTYVFHSPLQKRLSRLKMLDMKGGLDLDLNLEIPLYPENDKILAEGKVIFDKNQVTVHHALNNLTLNNVTGSLKFDEHGITDSALEATIADDPISMRIQSIRQPQPYTQVDIEGNTSMSVLQSKLNVPVLSRMQGHLHVKSRLTLTDDPSDLDHLNISTSLEDVNIAMPKPFGKSAGNVAPLTLDLDFNLDKALRLRVNYSDRLSADLWFGRPKENFILQKGEVRLGGGQALWQKQEGVQLVGTLPVFNLEEWQEVFKKLPTTKSPYMLPNSINFIDVMIKNATILSKNYQDLIVKAYKKNEDDWSVKLRQKDITANLIYQIKTNTLKGNFERLCLSKADFPDQNQEQSPSALKPEQIPNLDINIDKFVFGEVDVGSVALKSNSTPTNWQLEYCKIESSDYQLTIEGDWEHKDSENKTQLEAKLLITNLAKSLERWHITPVVESKHGEVHFKGEWPGALNDFSLATIDGDMYIAFKNGRITHLSSETEEKIGLGKLLSILSMQTIPRRLKLDFSDLSKKGYSFDEFKGTFVLKNGVMSTKDSYIDGPVAYANMKGDLDVVKQLYDLHLTISPHITASLPVVATIAGGIAGGPIAGIATWVASKIINQSMQKISSYSYKVSGPWLHPVVQQISIVRKKR